MVLIMVLMSIIIMMIFSIGVISRGVSGTKSSESQIDRIKSEQLAMGAYAKSYSDLTAGGAMNTAYSATLDNKTYTATVVNNGPGGPNNTNTLTITAPF